MTRLRSPVLALLAGLALGAPAAFLYAQQDPVFSTNVEVVNLFATVRDRHGKLINDLTKDDFVLKENGDAQEIRYFSKQVDLPLTIGMLVDTSMSQVRLIDEERQAGYRFFDQVLNVEKDLAFVIKFDRDVELLQDLTASKGALEDALGRLHAPDELRRFGIISNNQFPGGIGIPFPGGGMGRGRGRYPGSGYPGGGYPGGGYPGGGYPGGRGGGQYPVPGNGQQRVGTAMYDAVFLASDEVLHNQGGRKAIVLISDGVDVGSKISPQTAIETAQRADVVVYSICYEDRSAYRGGGWGGGLGAPDGERALRDLSEQTGGRMYRVAGDQTLARVFSEVDEELRSQYSIGFSPHHERDIPGFRKIDLKAKGDGLKVYTRAGYYPKNN